MQSFRMIEPFTLSKRPIVYPDGPYDVVAVVSRNTASGDSFPTGIIRSCYSLDSQVPPAKTSLFFSFALSCVNHLGFIGTPFAFA